MVYFVQYMNEKLPSTRIKRRPQDQKYQDRRISILGTIGFALDRAIESGGDATIKPKIQISAGGVCYAEVLTEGKEVT
jgi:hypothetical protein